MKHSWQPGTVEIGGLTKERQFCYRVRIQLTDEEHSAISKHGLWNYVIYPKQIDHATNAHGWICHKIWCLTSDGKKMNKDITIRDLASEDGITLLGQQFSEPYLLQEFNRILPFIMTEPGAFADGRIADSPKLGPHETPLFPELAKPFGRNTGLNSFVRLSLDFTFAGFASLPICAAVFHVTRTIDLDPEALSLSYLGKTCLVLLAVIFGKLATLWFLNRWTGFNKDHPISTFFMILLFCLVALVIELSRRTGQPPFHPNLPYWDSFRLFLGRTGEAALVRMTILFLALFIGSFPIAYLIGRSRVARLNVPPPIGPGAGRL